MWTSPEVRRYRWDNEAIPREKAAATPVSNHVLVAIRHNEAIPRDKAAATVEQCVAAANDHGVGLWCVLRKPSGAFAGFCGFRFIEGTTEVELLYGLLPEHHGQGFATEACRAAVAHSFETRLFTRLLSGAKFVFWDVI
jgi:RimJ/RimL family protein N-acetyltransferase